VNYPAPLGRGFLLHSPPHRERVHRLDGAFHTCYSNKILILESEFFDIDRRVDVAVVVSAAVRTHPFSMRKGEIPLEVSTGAAYL